MNIPSRERERENEETSQADAKEQESKQRKGLDRLNEVRKYQPERETKQCGKHLEKHEFICGYLLELACFKHTFISVLVIGQAKEDVVSDGAGHDPGCLGGVRDSTAVSDLPGGRNQFSEDGHQQ